MFLGLGTILDGPEELWRPAAGRGGRSPARFIETDTIVFPGDLQETWVLDRPMPVAYSVTGQPLIRTTQDFQIVAASSMPAVDDQGRAFNGFMDTPQITTRGSLQGFDQYAAETVVKPQQRMDYGNALPLPLRVSVNQTGTLMQGLRDPALPELAGFRGYLACALVERDRPVPEGFFAPAYNDPNADILLTEGDARWCYGSHTALDGYPNADRASCLAALPSNRALIYCGNDADAHRRLMVTEQGGYARDWAQNFGPSGVFLHSSAPRTEKREVWLRRVQLGLDAYGLLANEAYAGQYGAGQYLAAIELMMDFAFASGNVDILTAATGWRCNLLDQPILINETDLRHAPVWGDTNDTLNRIFLPEQLGQPHWGLQGRENPEYQGSISSRYQSLNFGPFLYAALSIGLMRNGPGGVSGYDVLTDRGTHVLRYVDQVASADGYGDGGGANAVHPDLRSVYKTIRADIGPIDRAAKPWPTRKEFATGGDGKITLDLSDVIQSNSLSPVLQVQAMISQDGGISGKIVDIPLSGNGIITVSAAAGVHHCRLRARNESGWSVWSYNHPSVVGDPEVSIATVTDSGPDRAPTIVVPAHVSYRPYTHPTPVWRKMPTHAVENVVSYVASSGYVDMKPVVQPSIQWFLGHPAEGGVALSGQMRRALKGDAAAYAGQQLYARMIWDNGVAELIQTLGPVAVGQATYGVLQPGSDDFNLMNLQQIWNNGDTSFQYEMDNVLRLRINQSGSAHAARLIDLGPLEIAGDITGNLPEGDLVVLTRAYTGGTDVAGFVFRASGEDQVNADGYGVDIYFETDRAEFRFATITDGIVTRDRANIGVDYEDGVDREPGSGAIWTRINWREDSTGFVVRIRVWPDRKAEVSAWDYIYTFDGPIKTGTKMGLGVSDQAAGRRYGALAVSQDPDLPAPLSR